MIYGSDIFPILSTKLISIENQNGAPKVIIDYCLASHTEQNISAWYNDSAEMPAINTLRLYFMVLDDDSYPLLADLIEPANRTRFLASLNQRDAYNLNRYQALTSISLQDAIFDNTAYRHAPTNTPSGEYNSLHGRIEIPYQPLNNLRDSNSKDFHLVCFVHMEVGAVNQGQTGGNLVYDFLFTRDEKGEVKVPTFRNAFYINQPRSISAEEREAGMMNSQAPSLRPYTGPAHYHGPGATPIGTDGYVGWMAGHADGRMGPRLETREVRNYKVSTSLHAYSEQEYISEELTGYNDISEPSGLETLVSSGVMKEESEKLIELVRDSLFSHRRSTPSVLDPSPDDASYIRLETSQSDAPMRSSHHGCVIGINMLDAVRYNSIFGKILDHHHNAGNEEFVNRSLNKSKIIDMKFKRQRIKTTPTEVNFTRSPKYVKYNILEPDVSMVSTRDDPESSPAHTLGNLNMKHHLIPAISPRASVEEVEMHTIHMMSGIPQPGPKYSRQFVLRDYDLFNNISTGKYVYILDITIQDGTRESMLELLREASQSLSRYDEYLFKAKHPAKNVGTANEQGSYDHDTGLFTSTFKLDTSYDEIIVKCANIYSEMRSFISGTPVLEDAHEQLMNILSPPGATMENLDRFREILHSMCQTVREIFNIDRTLQPVHTSRNSTKTNPSNSRATIQETFSLSMNAGVIVDAFSRSNVLADYQVGNRAPSILTPEDFEVHLRENPSFVFDSGLAANLLEPNRFVTIEPPRYDLEVEPPQHPIPDLPAIATMDMSRISPDSFVVLSALHAGHLREVVRRDQYNSMNRIKKSNLEIKMGLLRTEEAVLSSAIEKEDVYFTLKTKSLAGVALSLSTDKSEFLNPLQDTSNDEWLKRSLPSVSRDFRNSICKAAYRGDDRDTFLDAAEETFGGLVETRERLSGVYDHLFKMFDLMRDVTTRNIQATSHKERFLGQGKVKIQSKLDDKTCFAREGAHIEILVPGRSRQQYKLGKIQLDKKPSKTRLKKVIFVKMKQNKEADQIIPVNNACFLEI